MVAQHQGVAHGLERPAVRRHAGDDVEVDDRAAGQHQVVVVLPFRGPGGRGVGDEAPGQVDAAERRGAALHARHHLPDRGDDVHGVDGRADHVAQQRGKDEMVFLAEEDHVPARRRAALETFGGVDAGEAAADDDDVLGCGGHGPVPCLLISGVILLPLTAAMLLVTVPALWVAAREHKQRERCKTRAAWEGGKVWRPA